MAQPAFQAKDLIERHGIAVISGNLQFYTDMSNRVMQVFGELGPGGGEVLRSTNAFSISRACPKTSRHSVED